MRDDRLFISLFSRRFPHKFPAADPSTFNSRTFPEPCDKIKKNWSYFNLQWYRYKTENPVQRESCRDIGKSGAANSCVKFDIEPREKKQINVEGDVQNLEGVHWILDDEEAARI